MVSKAVKIGGVVAVAILLIIAIVLGVHHPKKDKDKDESPAALVGTTPLFEFPLNEGSWGARASFKDQSAKWLWSVDKASTVSVPAATIKLKAQYFNATDKPVDVIAHVMVDDSATISLNGAGKPAVGGYSGSTYPQIKFKLQPGNNVFVVAAKNVSGSAGFAMSIIDADGKVLLNTNAKDWVCA
jgi:hypothetical protein